jgi:hypothetical protein
MSVQVGEFLVLEFALGIGNPDEGRSAMLPQIQKLFTDRGAKPSELDAYSILLGMNGESLIELRRWVDGRGFVTLAEFGNTEKFFWGDFRIKVTYKGQKHYDALRAALVSSAPSNHWPIGFGL